MGTGMACFFMTVRMTVSASDGKSIAPAPHAGATQQPTHSALTKTLVRKPNLGIPPRTMRNGGERSSNRGAVFGTRLARKQFFFEKKNQKTFDLLGSPVAPARL
jgi:hypothetical protein